MLINVLKQHFRRAINIVCYRGYQTDVCSLLLGMVSLACGFRSLLAEAGSSLWSCCSSSVAIMLR